METRLMSPLDPVHAQEKKIAKIHNEITKVESQMMKQASIINRLEHLQEVEDKRTQRIMERLGKRKYVINEEVERLYGKDPSRRYNDSPVESAVVEDIIQHRNKEHALAQEEAALRMKYLNIERQRLQDARERLRERRNNLVYAPSPVGRETLKAWGDKYNIYTPLAYDYLLDVYSPRYTKRETFLPRVTWATGRKYTFYPTKRYRRRSNNPRYLAAPACTAVSLNLW